MSIFIIYFTPPSSSFCSVTFSSIYRLYHLHHTPIFSITIIFRCLLHLICIFSSRIITFSTISSMLFFSHFIPLSLFVFFLSLHQLRILINHLHRHPLCLSLFPFTQRTRPNHILPRYVFLSFPCLFSSSPPFY